MCNSSRQRPIEVVPINCCNPRILSIDNETRTLGPKSSALQPTFITNKKKIMAPETRRIPREDLASLSRAVFLSGYRMKRIILVKM